MNAEGYRIILAMAYATEGRLAFEPNTDDMREAPSLDIIKGLVARRGAVIATEWKEFRSPDFPAIEAALKTAVIFDGRNLYEPSDLAMLGFEYHAIGRPVPAAGKG